MRQTELKLSWQDRQVLDEFRSKGIHMARELNRAHILSALDRNAQKDHSARTRRAKVAR